MQVFTFILQIFLAIYITGGSVLSYEILQRANKIRFPTETTPLTQQIYTVGPPNLFEAESQPVPVVIKGIKNVPYTVLQQVPVSNIPYGEFGAKGFNDGLIPYYQPLIRQDSEFHHTVPPPIRIPAYTQQTVTITKPKQQVPLQNMQHKPQRHQERVRLSPPKYNPNQHIKTRPTIASLQPAPPAQAHLNKELKHHLPVYKYPIVLQSMPQNNHYNEYPENDYEEETYRRPAIKNVRINQNTAPLPQYSEEYTDFEEKIPEWKLKPNGGVRDISLENNSHYYKKQKLQRPESDESKYYDDDTEGSFSYEDQRQEPLPNYNRYNKHYVPIKSNIAMYKPKKELKKTREPFHENLKQYHYHSKPTSVEFFSSKDITDTLPYINKAENYKQSIQYNTQNSKKIHEFNNSPKLITGSEWIPINAPKGALPAKSYEIPAPDLSRGHEHWHNSQEASIEPDEINTRDQRLGSVVYGGRKQQSEGVVSASVLVKQ